MREAIHFKLNGKPVSLTADGERMFYGFCALIRVLQEPNTVVVRVCAVPAQFL